ncbi:hypothetical protein G5714_002856 [Onychostoma macrolepis]|uniref:Uncharacterized protein n=1 Tax=Onychostoma macrolepis TaxID=369639 RepID=A0A7J6D7W3_9TELE|nr:hypothetical protein G5714_002856 [Onychostoma macrolepis]
MSLKEKETLITLCHHATSRDPQQFGDPDAFIPQRWLSHSEIMTRPLMHGLFFSHILMHFNVEPAEESDPVPPITRTHLVPERQISVHFIER